MIRNYSARLFVTLFLLSALAVAGQITGTVRNATTDRPSAGDEVILLNMAEGMGEADRTTTDAKGKFTFKDTKDDGTYIIRVKHGAVDYHKPLMPGSSDVEVQVFDAAANVDGVQPTVRMMRIYAEGGNLFITDLFAIKNNSNPPRTKMSEKSFEFLAPEGVEVLGGFALGAGQRTWLKSAPVPTGEPNRYAMIYPLRPGETRFQLEYRMPYQGSASLAPKLLQGVEHLLVMLPTSMQFKAAGDSVKFEQAEENGAMMYVTTSVKPEQNLAFTLSGTGTFPPEGQEQAAQQPENRPGGGLGPPRQEPDPLQKYRWWILGGILLAMVGGAAFVLSRKQPEVPMAQPVDVTQPTPLAANAAIPHKNGDRSKALLESLKEELFALETERLEGKIGEADYQKAKAALDHTIQRALARRG